MDIKLYVLVCVIVVSAALQRLVEAGGGSSSSKGDGAPWGSYFSRGFGGFYSPDDFAPDPILASKPQYHHGRSHALYDSADDGVDDTQRTLSRGDLLQSHIPAVPDAQSRNIPFDTKHQQDWTQDTQQDMQHDWSQDTQQHEQHDFQQDTQLTQRDIFEEDVQQHDNEPQDFVTGYPPAKGHNTHVPHVPTLPPPHHTQPPFHTTQPVQHTTYQPEPPVQHTTYQPEPPVQHTTYQTEPPVYHTTYHPAEPTTQHTTYQPDLSLQHTTSEPGPVQHTTYEQEPVQHTTYENEHIKEHTTRPSYEVTTFPGTSEYETTTTYLENHGVCRPNPAAQGYPHGTKLLCTVEICDSKSSRSKTSTHSQATLVCRPYKGCDEASYTTEKPEYTTKDHGYTTDHPDYTTESHYTTEHPGYTTEHPVYTTERGHTTDHPGYTTESEHSTTVEYTTEHPIYTTPPPYKTHTTEHPEYTTTQKEVHTDKPVHTTQPYSPTPTLPPTTTPHQEERTPCVRGPGVKGGVRGCNTGVKGGVKGVKGGHHQPRWDSWSSWTSWDDWEPRRQGLRKQQTFWHPPRTQERRHHEVRRPVWNGAWPSSFSAQDDSAPAYVFL